VRCSGARIPAAIIAKSAEAALDRWVHDLDSSPVTDPFAQHTAGPSRFWRATAPSHGRDGFGHPGHT
jgi:hypothetical protein